MLICSRDQRLGQEAIVIDPEIIHSWRTPCIWIHLLLTIDSNQDHVVGITIKLWQLTRVRFADGKIFESVHEAIFDFLIHIFLGYV